MEQRCSQGGLQAPRQSRRHATPGAMRRLRRNAALSVVFSWVMAVQLLLHGVLMLLPVNVTGGLGVICSIAGARPAPQSGGGQLPPCCTDGDCCCLPSLATLPGAPVIPGAPVVVHAPFRPTPIAAHTASVGWRWQPRAPPLST